MNPTKHKMNSYGDLFLLVFLAFLSVYDFSEANLYESITFTTVDGSDHEFKFTANNASECLFINQNDAHIACMNDQSYTDVETAWKSQGNDLQYVKVNCVLQNSIRRHSRYCICKSRSSEEYFPCQIEDLFINHFRSVSNLQVLDLSYNMIHAIGQRSFYGLSKVRYLSLRHNEVTNSRLPYGVLCDMPNLEYLDLSDLQLDVFPSHIFKCENATSKLKALDISNSTLVDVPKRSLEPFHALESLNLGSNLLGKLHRNSFEGASTLMDVNVSDNTLYDLFPEFCATIPKLRTLYLGQNEFTTFKFDEIEDCSLLKLLDISDNNITSFSGSIANFTALERFNVSNNELETFDLNLNSLSRLQYLDISHNFIQHIDEEKLKGLVSLSQLNINHNFINDSNNFPKLFENFESLEYLDMQHNTLTYIPENCFAQLKNLTHLYINNNAILTLHNNSFTGLMKLKNLYLQSNLLRVILPAVFRPLKALEYISLANNQLVTVSVDMWPSTLAFLYLDGNELTSVPDNIDYTSLTVLNVSDNLISDFDIKNNTAPNLKTIDLSHNRLSSFGEHLFSAAPNLIDLNLENNKLSFNISSTTFRESLKLNSLNLAKNSIEKIGKIFSDNSLNNLKILNVSYNPFNDIKQFSSEFSNSNIEMIDISNCNISTVDRNVFADLPKLTSVRLKDNKIETFEVFNASVDTTFDFTGNPIKCSCHLVWLKEPYVEFEGKRVSMYRYHVPKCTAYGLDGLYSPQALRRDQYVCVEKKSCDSKCTCLKRDPNGSIYTAVCRDQLTAAPAVLPSSAHTIFLDGNNFINESLGILSNFTNMSTREIYLNGSSIRSLHPGIFEGFSYLEIINLAFNKLTSVPDKLFANHTALKQLYLQDNQLSDFDPGVFDGLDNLKEIDISGNRFKYLDSEVIAELDALPSVKYFFLARNSWRCDCHNRDFKTFIDKVQYRISDRRKLTCNGQEMLYVPKSAFTCASYDKPQSNNIAKTTLIVISCVVLAFIIAAVCFYFRRECVAVIYSGTGIHIPSRHRFTSGKPFDVFISYDPMDQHASEYVQTQLLPKLRTSRHHCQTSHDLIQDVEVTKKAIEDSKCSLFVINKNFATDPYLVKVFHIASDYSKTGHHKVILLIHGDIDILTLEPEIVMRLRRGDYITARARLWWHRLRYELPVSAKFQANEPDNDSEADTIIFSAIADEGYYNSMSET